jgi:hypothetical protein
VLSPISLYNIVRQLCFGLKVPSEYFLTLDRPAESRLRPRLAAPQRTDDKSSMPARRAKAHKEIGAANKATCAMFLRRRSSVLLEGEGDYGLTGGYGDVLLSVEHVGHRGSFPETIGLELP